MLVAVRMIHLMKIWLLMNQIVLGCGLSDPVEVGKRIQH